MKTENWQPDADQALLRQRARLVRTIRQFFAVRDVMEVFTPVVVKSGVTDPHLDSFELQHSAGFLRTSPEYAMKRLLAAGSGDIYELGQVFRQGEAGRRHNPEFTMLEWYRVGWHYQQLIDEVIELLHTCSPDMLALWPVQKSTYTDLSQQVLGIDVAAAEKHYLIKLAHTHGWHMSADETSHSMLLDFIFSHLLQPALPDCSLNIITDFPPSQAALAQLRNEPDGCSIAERFEVFLGQLELANGYQELTSADEQQQRFIEDRQIREGLNKPAMQADQKLLQALRHGLPPCTGVALGIDRLLMLLTDTGNIENIQAFAWSNT